VGDVNVDVASMTDAEAQTVSFGIEKLSGRTASR
jgi:hypothetical protein